MVWLWVVGGVWFVVMVVVWFGCGTYYTGIYDTVLYGTDYGLIQSISYPNPEGLKGRTKFRDLTYPFEPSIPSIHSIVLGWLVGWLAWVRVEVDGTLELVRLVWLVRGFWRFHGTSGFGTINLYWGTIHRVHSYYGLIPEKPATLLLFTVGTVMDLVPCGNLWKEGRVT